MTEAPESPRRAFWILVAGIVLVLAGPALHVIRTLTRHLENPWPAPIISTAGLALVVLGARRRRSGRTLALVAAAALVTAVTWLYVAVGLRLPGYNGPIRAGQELAAFVALRADGRTFGLDDLKQGPSALVFYRHW